MKLISSFLVLVSLIACKKDKPDCEENKYGWFRLHIGKTSTWTLFIDGIEVIEMHGSTQPTYIKDVSAGPHTIKCRNYQKTDSSTEVINIPQCDSVIRYK